MQTRLLEIVHQHEVPGDFTYPADVGSQIGEAEAVLGVELPKDYIEFLRSYGHGGIGGIEVIGVGKTGKALFVDETLKYRNYGLPENLVLIENCDEWVYCIDCNSGEVVSWDRGEVSPAYQSFTDYLLDRFQDAAENM